MFKKIVTLIALVTMVIGAVKQDTALAVLATQAIILLELKELRETKKEEKVGCGCKH